MRPLVIDIESNALLSNSIDYSSFPYKLRSDASLWCIVVTNAITKQSVIARKEQCTKEWLRTALEGCTHIIGHNILKFDFPLLKLFGVLDYTVAELDEKDTIFGNEVSIIDTLLISRLFNPDRFGGHSLEAWGERLGSSKTDFRQVCIDRGYISKNAPKGLEFQSFCDEMVDYCVVDTKVNANLFVELVPELKNVDYWLQAIKVEKKLAHLAVNRESLGFWFNKDLAISCIEDLRVKMETIAAAINPILPLKPRNKGELAEFTPPKLQLKQDGGPTSAIAKFVQKIGAELKVIDDKIHLMYKDKAYPLPVHEPLELYIEADINNLDHVKMYLISLGWEPTEWKERDLTRDSKKVLLPYDKRLESLERWFNETMAGKYKQERLELLGINPDKIIDVLSQSLKDNRPVRVPTSPCVRVGVEKDLCPNLTSLGSSVDFANDFTLYLTYKHRKNCIAGGDIEDMDFDMDSPNTGYLSNYREQDQRVPTPAIEVGAATFRYKHISVANVPRATSIYGKEMRSLFGSGPEADEFGFDFSSLEARIMAHYVIDRTDGIALAESMLAEKPNDFHCFSEDTEILTQEGWKLFKDITLKTFVADYNSETKESNWVNPTSIIWEYYEGKMVSINSINTDQLLTPNHRVYTEEERSKNGKIDFAIDILDKSYTSRRFICGSKIKEGIEEDSAFVKLLVATQADGSFAKDCSAITYTFTKKSKTERLENILDELKIKYTKTFHTRKGRVETTFRLNASPDTVKIRSWLGNKKELKYNLLNLSYELRKIILNELPYWDASVGSSGVIVDITCEQTIDVLQSIATSLGVKSNKTKFFKTTNFGGCKIHRLFMSTKVDCVCGVYGTKKKLINYKGKVGCVSVPNGLVIVRRNGKVFISGNSLNAVKLNISRGDAKSFGYGIIYGASAPKLGKMLGIPLEKASELYTNFWEGVPGLKELKVEKELEWENNAKMFITTIDGRKLNIRSKHSILNALFQSSGVIFTKYVTVLVNKKLEELGYNTSPFVAAPDICSMIEYHDECQYYARKGLFTYKSFEDEKEAKKFVKEWKGEQLSTIVEGKKFYVALPNILSKTIIEAIKEAEKILNLKVSMAMEYAINNTWYGCH